MFLLPGKKACYEVQVVDEFHRTQTQGMVNMFLTNLLIDNTTGISQSFRHSSSPHWDRRQLTDRHNINKAKKFMTKWIAQYSML